MLYELLTEALAPAETGSVASTGGREAAAKSQSTLLPSDMTPTWRAPLPRPDPRSRHSV